MPVRESSNNRILPANARAADVAEKAINEILDVQHRRYLSAFRPQGIETILYHRLNQGRKCTCNSAHKQVNSRLDESGKADLGTINELLTGVQEFTVSAYGSGDQRRLHNNEMNTSPFAPVNKNQGVFDIVSDEELPFARSPDSLDFGDNGPFNPETLDDLVGDFDVGVVGMQDAACSVCFGTGFIGGYAVHRGFRNVLTVTDVELASGDLDLSATPFTAVCTGFEVATALPAGALLCDAFTLWNGPNKIPFRLYIDEEPVANPAQTLRYCDGKRHLIRVAPYRDNTAFEFTHIEIQYALSNESSYFEFPKMSSSSDTALLDQTNPFNIVVSPDIPILLPRDVLRDCTTSKTLIVKNVNDWNTRNRRVLGWECEVRVLQPMELQTLLPHRRPLMTKNATGGMVRDNVTGPRRT